MKDGQPCLRCKMRRLGSKQQRLKPKKIKMDTDDIAEEAKILTTDTSNMYPNVQA